MQETFCWDQTQTWWALTSFLSRKESKNSPDHRSFALTTTLSILVIHFHPNHLSQLHIAVHAFLSPGRRGVLPEKFGGGVRPTSQNPYPILDQNLRFSLPFYDPTKNSVLYLWPDPLINTLFQTGLIISYLVQTDVVGSVKGFCWSSNR